jgi:FkbM family methyltransferase
MLSLPLPSKDFLIKQNRIQDNTYILASKLEKNFLNNISMYYDKYNLLGEEKLEINVFKYHCGLKFLPKEVHNQIKNTTFIDIGGFWGDSTLIFLKYLPKAIITFEPNSYNYQWLCKTIINNNIQDICRAENMGIFYKDDIKEMNYISSKQNHGASLVFKPYKAKVENVKLIALDNYNIDEKVGFIKIDAEGTGLQALWGAKRLINKYKPLISCAIYHHPLELFNIKLYLEKLNPSYKFKIVNLNNNFILKELTLLAY